MAKTGTFVDQKTREQIRTPGYYDEIYSADGKERLDHRLEQIDSDLTVKLLGRKAYIKKQTFSNISVNNTWGSLYESQRLSIDYSDLGLSSPPSLVLVSFDTNSGGCLIEESDKTNTTYYFYICRGTSINGLTIGVSALIVE